MPGDPLTTSDAPSPLARFTGERRPTIDLSAIHRRGGIACATDGRTLAWRPEDGPDTDAKIPPDIWKWIAEADSAIGASASSVEIVGVTGLRVCGTCHGTLVSPKTQPCFSCDGAGEHTCDECDDLHECRRCRGSGRIPGEEIGPCEACEGDGKDHERSYFVRLCGQTWDAARVAKAVAALGSPAKIALAQVSCSPKQQTVLLVWSGELRILVLGLYGVGGMTECFAEVRQ